VLNAALSAITAAVVGVILNLAVWFAVHTLFPETVPRRSTWLAFDVPKFESVDLWAFAIILAAAVAMFRFKAGMIPSLSPAVWPGSLCISSAQ